MPSARSSSILLFALWTGCTTAFRSAGTDQARRLENEHTDPTTFQRQEADGSLTEYSEQYRGSFDYHADSNDGLMSSVIVTDEQLFLFKDTSAGPHGKQVSWQADKALRVGTVKMYTHDDQYKCIGLDECSTLCSTVSGCADDKCKAGDENWELCGPTEDVLKLQESIDTAYLSVNHIQERLAPAIAESIEGILNDKVTIEEGKTPQLFSPFVTSWLTPAKVRAGGNWNFSSLSSQGVYDTLRAVSASFAKGVIPYRPGKNSRSGAAFFFSSDRAYICKRIRPFERDSLWQFVKDGEYRRRILSKESVLNAIFVSFMNSGAPWIVMQAEALPASVKSKIQSGERIMNFFEDIKPPPLTSDRKKFTSMLLKVRAEMDFTFEDIPGWEKVSDLVLSDSKFLEDKNFVDYSLLVHGSFFYKPAGVSEDWEQSVAADVESKTGCAFGCSKKPPRRVVDVTKLILPFGKQGMVPIKSANYICCCRRFKQGDSLNILSPCAMVKTKLKYDIFKQPQECGELLGDNWHSYVSEDMVTNNRCLLAAGTWNATPPSEESESNMPQFLGPEAAFGLTAEAPQPCGVVCVSSLDYLLPLNAWNSVENVLLLPVYGSFKWSDYKGKITDMLDCLTRPPVLPSELPNGFEYQMMGSILMRDPRKFPQSDKCVRSDYESIMGPHGNMEADKTMLQHLLVKSHISDTGLPQTTDGMLCDPNRDIFPANCVVEPGTEGTEWKTQLHSQHCKGNLMMIRLSDTKLVGLRIMDAHSWLEGWFEYENPFTDDLDLMYLHSSTYVKKVVTDGKVEVQVYNKERGSWEKGLDFAVMGAGGQYIVLHKSGILTFALDDDGATIKYSKEGALMKNNKPALWGLFGSSPKPAASEEGSVSALGEVNLHACQQQKVEKSHV
eukprot:TRINITY_DN44998_c0_g1_i1.p1 TRINITY_DN44998_c0_g1~~TRINITY_DN44998_c0_g1_i1.p1  ORF type:complete len:896 (-),score=141.96 TRINITY_DN44998_c0_g1_i1:129-2816(-)